MGEPAGVRHMSSACLRFRTSNRRRPDKALIYRCFGAVAEYRQRRRRPTSSETFFSFSGVDSGSRSQNRASGFTAIVSTSRRNVSAGKRESGKRPHFSIRLPCGRPDASAVEVQCLSAFRDITSPESLTYTPLKIACGMLRRAGERRHSRRLLVEIRVVLRFTGDSTRGLL